MVNGTWTGTCGINTAGGYATVTAEDTKCWLATNLGTTIVGGYGDYYQWMRKIPGWKVGWKANNSDSEYGDPCPSGFQVPTIDKWSNLAGIIHDSPLQLSLAGIIQYDNGILVAQDSSGYYWSSSTFVVGNSVYAFMVYSQGNTMATNDYRNLGNALPIRCIQSIQD